MPKEFHVKNPRSGIKQDLIGKKSGKLTVTKQLGSKNNKVLWECICDCGNKTTINTHYFNCGKKTSCGCSRKALGNKHQTWKGHKEISGSFFTMIKAGAISRGLSFNITIEDIWNLFTEQKRKCSLTGLNINFSKSQKKTNREISTGTASLDRIDSSKGYEKDNIQWLHKDVNMMKNKFTEEYFINICKLITENKCK